MAIRANIVSCVYLLYKAELLSLEIQVIPYFIFFFYVIPTFYVYVILKSSTYVISSKFKISRYQNENDVDNVDI